MMSMLLQIARESQTDTGAAFSGKATLGDGRAWQREMERAQLQDWLKDKGGNQSVRTLDLSERLSMPNDGEVLAHQSLTSLATRLTLHAKDAPQTLAPGQQRNISEATPQGAVDADRDLVLGLGAAIERRAAEALRPTKGDGTDGMPCMDDAGQGCAGKTMSLPRITLERIGAGMRIWLGLDAGQDMSESSMEQLVGAIRKVLDDAGIPLESIICNGQVVVQLPEGRHADLIFQSYIDDPRRA